MAPQLYYDGTTSLSHFLHELYDRCYPQTPSAWIKAVYCRLAGEALEWAKKDEDVVRIYYNAYHNVAIDRDGRRLYQLLEIRFATPLHHRVDKALKEIKQGPHESIENYYTRVNTLFEHVGGQDRPIDVDKCLDHEHGSCLLKAVDYFVDGLRNTTLRRSMFKTLQEVSNEGNAAAVSLESVSNAAQWSYTMIKRTRKLRNRPSATSQVDTDTSIVIDMSQSCLEETTCDLPEISTSIYPPAHTSKPWLTQNWRARPLPEASFVDESPPVLVQIRPEISEISATTLDPSDTESTDEILASGPPKWPTPTTLSEIPDAYESPPVLEEMPCDLSETSTDIVSSSDTESTDEILASGPRKWTAAEKEVFDSNSTSASASKSPPAPDTDKVIEAVKAPDNSFAQGIVDKETTKEEVFEPTSIRDQESKNPPALYSEDIEISAAVDMSSLEHLTNEDNSVIGAFDSDTELGPPSKNPLIQHIEDSETMEKTSVSAFDSASDSAYIYELPALPAFDLTIDIDFGTYTTDTEAVIHSSIQATVTSPRRKMQLSPFRGLALRNTTFGWSRSISSSIDRRTSSISTCTTTSDVTVDPIETAKTVDTADTEFCEGEQLSCSTMYPCTTISDTDFYEEEQSSCSIDCFVLASVDVISIVSEHSDFYGGEQFCSPADTVDIVEIICSAVVVVDTDALTLTAGMVKKKKESSWISLLGLILLLAWVCIEYLATKSKHKGLPKVKIKRSSEPEHIESRSQTIAGISTESAYKMALFSGIQQRLGPLR
ncbi:hypothetical protein G7Y79_00011g030860 [Physcia stellaris]|nr:hypothetical protein G7Y79_00011g030860 [Physcia stellaris]